ncbi:MAG: 23S rRNA (uracil(1939)-C(5))-methyltransferase RlmD [Candidatus Cloacimonetes bacterium]|nr:23S rRNA (uracil(1939)-C(5))-methyltransferase RlmD [Candidatus Cloacimonadota bacterium]
MATKFRTADLRIESIAYGGLGVARPEAGPVVFVEGGLPGDTVRAVITKKRKRHQEARVLDLLEPSPLRISARCIHQNVCGGCPLQTLEYAEQLRQKQKMVEDSWRRVGGFEHVEVEPILACEELWHYRNKMEFTFSDRQWVEDRDDPRGLRFGLGQHVRGIYSKVFDLTECHLQSELTAPLLEAIRRFVDPGPGKPADVWHVREQHGFWRFVVIREGKHTGERMLNLVTNGPDDGRVRQLADRLLEQFPGALSTIVHTISERSGAVASGRAGDVLHGPGVIHEDLDGLRFRLAPQAFFQTNTRQAERLFALAREMAGTLEGVRMLDLYCGSGAIAACFSRFVQHAVGIELVPEAIENARENARLNGLDNLEFHCGDVRHALAEHAQRPFDLVVVDPPRAGLHADVTRQLLEMSPQRLVYVSCNPVTQARDAALLAEGGYRLRRLRPVDMFPHTFHVETVALLSKD